MLIFEPQAIFLQFTLPIFMFSNKTVTEAKNNPASSPLIMKRIGNKQYSEDLGTLIVCFSRSMSEIAV